MCMHKYTHIHNIYTHTYILTGSKILRERAKAHKPCEKRKSIYIIRISFKAATLIQ